MRTSASPGSVTRKPTFAKAESKESHALTTLNAIRLWLAGLLQFGHMRLSACQWLMWGLSAILSSTASQGTSAGSSRRVDMVSASRSILLPMAFSSFGTTKSIQQLPKNQCWLMASIANLELLSEIHRIQTSLNACSLTKSRSRKAKILTRNLKMFKLHTHASPMANLCATT